MASLLMLFTPGYAPSTQFKNQFIFLNLLFHEQDYRMPADRNFLPFCKAKVKMTTLVGMQ